VPLSLSAPLPAPLRCRAHGTLLPLTCSATHGAA
jgi:hypothetical protein